MSPSRNPARSLGLDVLVPSAGFSLAASKRRSSLIVNAAALPLLTLNLLWAFTGNNPASACVLLGTLTIIAVIQSFVGWRLTNLTFQMCAFFAFALKNWYEFKFAGPYYGGFGSDDRIYDKWGGQFYNLDTFDFMEVWSFLPESHNSPGYVYLIGMLHHFAEPLGGYDLMLPRILNMFLLANIGALVFKYLRDRSEVAPLTEYAIAFGLCLFPSMLYQSAHVYRDTIISYLTVLVFYSGCRRGNMLFRSVPIVVAISIMWGLRQLFAALLIGLTPILFLPIRRISNRQLILVGLLMLTYAAIAAQFGAVTDVVDQAVRRAEQYTALNQQRFGAMGSKVFQGNVVLTFPLRILFVFMTPAPKFNYDLVQGFLGVGTVLQFFALPFVVRSLLRDETDGKLKVSYLLIISAVACSTFSSRHMLCVIPFTFLLGIEEFNRSRLKGDFSWYYPYLIGQCIVFTVALMFLLII